VPTRIPTSGFSTDVMAMDGASLPVASETCCTRKARMPATANAQNSQLESIPPRPSASRVSAVAFQSEAESPYRRPAHAPNAAALRCQRAAPAENNEQGRGDTEHDDDDRVVAVAVRNRPGERDPGRVDEAVY
jgi:hypothetical protein